MTSQLDAATLHAAARQRGREAVPDAFLAANEQVDATKDAYRAAVAARHQLVRDAHTIGVPYVALSRWTGLTPRTLHEIVNGA